MVDDWPHHVLEAKLNHRFTDRALLREALAHASRRADDTTAAENGRLAFLGDAILGLVVAETLFVSRKDASKADLTQARAAFVANANLAKVGLGDALRLDVGGSISDSRGTDAMRATAVEAIIGAAYRDGGHVAAVRVIRALMPNLPLACDVCAPGAATYDPQAAAQPTP